MALGTQGCGRHWRRAFGLYPGALTQTGIFIPLVLTAVYAFLSIRFDGTSILDFIRYAIAFLITKQQFYEWRM